MTIQPDPDTVAYLVSANNNGFAPSDPYESMYDLGQLTGRGGRMAPFSNYGPNDHGANFQFEFDPLDAGKSLSFNIYYGAAESQKDAEGALRSVLAEAYSLAKPATKSFNFYADFDNTAARHPGTCRGMIIRDDACI